MMLMARWLVGGTGSSLFGGQERDASMLYVKSVEALVAGIATSTRSNSNHHNSSPPTLQVPNFVFWKNLSHPTTQYIQCV